MRRLRLKRKVKVLIALTSFLICIFMIQDTYAKYINTASGNANMDIARWRILVNNQDIRDNSEISQVITPELVPNEHIKEGVIAPTSEGYFDLIIDSTSADVSFSYSINMEVDENSPVKDLVIKGYSLNEGEMIPVTNGEDITNTISYQDNVTTTNIRVYLMWDDGEGSSMDNAMDTDATLSLEDAKLKVNLSFIQVAS